MAKQDNTPATENAAAPKTLQEKLADAQARVAKLQAQINTQEILNSVKAGDTATFNYGRSDTARVLDGVITAVGDKTDERGRVTRLAIVSVGEGLDIETYKVRVADILTINGEDAPASEADEADEAADEAPEAPAADEAAEDPFATK